MNSTTTKQVYRIGVQGMDCRACEKLLLKHVDRSCRASPRRSPMPMQAR